MPQKESPAIPLWDNLPATCVVLLAAGQSSRFAGASLAPAQKKPFASLYGRAVWLHSLAKFAGAKHVRQIMLVVAPEDRAFASSTFSSELAEANVELINGGAQRADSAAAALKNVDPSCELVCLHDAARPLVATADLLAVHADAARHRAALLAAPVRSTLKSVNPQGEVQGTVSRTHLWEAQTPQVFERNLILTAHRQRGEGEYTDDAQLVERLGVPVHITPASSINFKITTQEDMLLAEALLRHTTQTEE